MKSTSKQSHARVDNLYQLPVNQSIRASTLDEYSDPPNNQHFIEYIVLLPNANYLIGGIAGGI